ncbi:hypothetical protein ABZV34_13610 [Streptomyces sp. NPDC005195]|uniref:hypothetical protein n=1 Tax=Streptomyces sp. NPDC005195 TaxID=3154561 RepID=UPI0033A69A5F
MSAMAPSIPRDLVAEVPDVGAHRAGPPDGRGRAQGPRSAAATAVAVAAKQRRTTLEYAPDQAGQAREPAGVRRRAAPVLKPGGSESDLREPPAIAPPSVGT